MSGSGRAERLLALAWKAMIALVVLFMLAPLLIVVVNSFSSVSFGTWPPPGWSLRWYQNLLHQEDFRAAALRSLAVASVATAGSVVLGVLAALALVRLRFPGRALVRGFLRSPMIVPHVAIGLAGFILFARIGLYGHLHNLMVAHVVFALPFSVAIVAAALLRVDRTLEEAARDLGAGPLRTFAAVTLPQVRTAVVAAALLSFIVSFDEVDASIFMAGSDQATLPIAMFLYLQNNQDPTLAALSAVLIVATLLLGVALFALFGTRGLGEVLSSRNRGKE